MPRMRKTNEANTYAKECSRCKVDYKVNATDESLAFVGMRLFFTGDNSATDSLYGHCKECGANISNLRYGNKANREDLLKAQDGKCAICKKPTSFEGHHTACIDHDHKTGAIRGVLCSPCNKALGTFGDDIDVLQAAIDYLKLHSTIN